MVAHWHLTHKKFTHITELLQWLYCAAAWSGGFGGFTTKCGTKLLSRGFSWHTWHPHPTQAVAPRAPAIFHARINYINSSHDALMNYNRISFLAQLDTTIFDLTWDSLSHEIQDNAQRTGRWTKKGYPVVPLVMCHDTPRIHHADFGNPCSTWSPSNQKTTACTQVLECTYIMLTSTGTLQTIPWTHTAEVEPALQYKH